MSALEETTKDLIRQHPRWGEHTIAYELECREGKRPTMPVLRKWIKEIRQEDKR